MAATQRPFPTMASLASIEAFLRARVDSGSLPHAQFLAARDGEILHSFHYGRAREDGTPIRPDAIYRIASMTKAVTATLFLMLWEEGRVALDDPVARYLPELGQRAVYEAGAVPPFVTRPALRQPTILDLLRHTAGFTYGLQPLHPLDQAYWTSGVYNFKATLTRETLLSTLSAMPLLVDPGERFSYSVATDLLGIIAERIADRPLSELFRSRIFAPLGMTDTGFSVADADADRLPDSWYIHPKRGRCLYDPAEGSIWRRAPRHQSGGGGLVSTVADYHRFCRMLLREGALDGERLLRADTVREMTRNHLPGGGSIGALSTGMFSGGSNRRKGHGLGIATTIKEEPGGPPMGEFHWSGLFGTWFSVMPALDLILIFMTQCIPETEESLADAVHERLFG